MGFVLNDVLSYKVNKNEPLKKKNKTNAANFALDLQKKKIFPIKEYLPAVLKIM